MLCFSYVLGRNTSAGVWTLCAHRRLPLEFLLSCSGPRYLVIFCSGFLGRSLVTCPLVFWIRWLLIDGPAVWFLRSLAVYLMYECSCFCPHGCSSAPMPSRFAVLACFNLVTNADTNLGVYVLERQIRDFATTGSLRSACPQYGSLGPRTTDLGTTVLKKYYTVSMFSHKNSMDLHGCSSMCHIFSLISYGFSLIPLIFIIFL